jgi:hypothetical protein
MKQETLEEAFKKYSEYLEDFENKNTYEYGFKDGIKYQQERSYSEEDMLKSYHCGRLYLGREGDTTFQEFLKKLNK